MEDRTCNTGSDFLNHFLGFIMEDNCCPWIFQGPMLHGSEYKTWRAFQQSVTRAPSKNALFSSVKYWHHLGYLLSQKKCITIQARSTAMQKK